MSTANENDGYVDMSSFNAFESKQQSADQEAERYREMTFPLLFGRYNYPRGKLRRRGQNGLAF